MSYSSRLPTLKQLRYLVALDRHQHFGRAAESCFVTQSTLSNGISELENLLGIKLVERTKRTVFMTALGRAVSERARALSAVQKTSLIWYTIRLHSVGFFIWGSFQRLPPVFSPTQRHSFINIFQNFSFTCAKTGAHSSLMPWRRGNWMRFSWPSPMIRKISTLLH